jgi:hypothetical protein
MDMKRHQTIGGPLLLRVAVGLLLLGVTLAAQRVVPPLVAAVVPEKLKDFVRVTDDMLVRPRPENWISFRNGTACGATVR